MEQRFVTYDVNRTLRKILVQALFQVFDGVFQIGHNTPAINYLQNLGDRPVSLQSPVKDAAAENYTPWIQ